MKLGRSLGHLRGAADIAKLRPKADSADTLPEPALETRKGEGSSG